jgi:beta-glucosidase
MCSYNRLNGTFACGNESSLTKILRDEIGFKGFVTSDWGAVHAVNFINAGLDMEMPGEPNPARLVYPIPSFFDLQSPCLLRLRALAGRHDEMANMFGGHIPEEPAPCAGGGGRLRRQAQPQEDGRGSEGRHRQRGRHHPRRRTRAL